MIVTTTQIFPEVLLIEPRIFTDERGYFLETFQATRYHQYGVPETFVQDNLSYSKKDVLRGLHYQLGRPQGKLVWVIQGVIFDVVVDIRRSSPTFGKWTSIILEARDHRQLYIPEGFAHGFCVMSEVAAVLYKCTDYYDSPEERGISWADPSLGIDWPVAQPVLSLKDLNYLDLKNIPPDQLPA